MRIGGRKDPESKNGFIHQIKFDDVIAIVTIHSQKYKGAVFTDKGAIKPFLLNSPFLHHNKR